MNIFLETERLVIHKPELSDVENLITLQSDPAVMQFIGDGNGNKIKVLHNLKRAITHQEKHNFSFGCVYEKETGEFIGDAGLVYLGYDDTQPDIEVGYALIQKYWNKGYATELTKALIQWGFQHINVTKICAVANPENHRSHNVLAKSGMQNVGKIILYTKELDLFHIHKQKS
jgi:ribosomal-protein-alanine N-acetyltransferase